MRQIQPLSIFKLFVLLFLSGTAIAEAQGSSIPPKPGKQTSVYQLGVAALKEHEAKILEQKLNRYADSTSTQIVVVVVPTTGGEVISRYATDLAHQWGIGQKGKDNGIIILVALNDRNITIQNGYGIEYHLTDALSKRIIENVIKPEFKKGDYYTGLDKATSVMMDILSGAYKGDGKKEPGNPFPYILILLFIIIFIILVSKGRNSGNNGGRGGGFKGPDLMDVIILSSLGRGGRGGFGGSGGSFGGGGFSGGFGGGGFGGGGASGSW